MTATRDALLVLHIQREMLTLIEAGMMEALPGYDSVIVEQAEDPAETLFTGG